MSCNKGSGFGVYVHSIRATVDYLSLEFLRLDRMGSDSKNRQFAT
jgi:hypothetical protein